MVDPIARVRIPVEARLAKVEVAGEHDDVARCRVPLDE